MVCCKLWLITKSFIFLSSKTLKILIEQEKAAGEYSTIQRELDRKKYASLMKLIVPGDKYVDAEGKLAEMPSNVYTDKDMIHDRLIDRNIKHFSAAKETPQGINGFIYNALGPHGTSEFSDRVLDGNMTEEDKATFDLVEAKEIFQATSRPDLELAPEKWTTETIEKP